MVNNITKQNKFLKKWPSRFGISTEIQSHQDLDFTDDFRFI